MTTSCGDFVGESRVRWFIPTFSEEETNLIAVGAEQVIWPRVSSAALTFTVPTFRAAEVLSSLS